ncbi:hypothetical protein GE061_013715 [Apolygus lucorum]|uniref:Uncharacterized protein n=1 Tax=Apolygus lucorum TaxID=248454 RepID=A0A6A4K9R7_APOLU|nr:hypothetical protein GE061_013715 [Apolygus lucorum]
MPARPSETSFRMSRPRSQTRERSNVSPLSWRRSPSEGNMRTRTPSPESSESDRKSPDPSKLTTVRQNSRGGRRRSPKIAEEVEEKDSEENVAVSDNEEVETFKRDVTSAGIESLEADEDDSATEPDLEVKHSLETCYSCRKWMVRHKFLAPVQATRVG